jgi:hypothetical protein
MWGSPPFCVYDWSNWDRFLIKSVWPKARRISANFNEKPQEVAGRLPSKTKFLLIHLNLSVMSAFIPEASEFVDVLQRRDVTAFNWLPLDIRKRTLQSQCRDFGLPCVAAPRYGPDEELLIVKTDLNSGGRREQLLPAMQKSQLNLATEPGAMKGSSDYFVSRRAELTDDVWNDPTLVVEQYMKNPLGRFFRIYVALNAVVISEAYTETPVKRMEGPIRRYNYFLWREEERIYDDSNVALKLPRRLLEIAGVFLNRFRLDYGAIDVVESEAGEFYMVDLNKTPFWGEEKQAGLVEHLHLGFSNAMRG